MEYDIKAKPTFVKKILVVDDSEIIHKTFALKLQGAGYQVIAALDGAMAVAAARKEVPNLILLDISFPLDVGGVEWDGFRILEWIRRMDSFKKTPIIIITGNQEASFKRRAIENGALAFFTKPIEHDELLKVIRIALGDETGPSKSSNGSIIGSPH
jgi:CheY-like chemotaxis protein